MIQLTRLGARISAAESGIARLRSEFEHQHHVRLPRLVDDEVLQLLQRRIAAGEFRSFVHDQGIGRDSNLDDDLTMHVLFFLTNDPRFVQAVREITACGRIGCFQGRVYRMTPGAGHRDSWHDDLVEDRAVGMSINLSSDMFQGGVFQLRDRHSGEILHEVANTGPGDGIVFRLAPHLQHRNTDISGTAPKTAFAGWFRSGSDNYHSWVRRELSVVAL